MSKSLHIVCPHCDTTNRVPGAKLADAPKCGKCKYPLFNASPVDLTTANFQKHIGHTDIPVVVDFWAPWCGPCQMMVPVFKQAAVQLEPGVRLAKLNTDQEHTIASQFEIRSIPTLVIFKGGREVVRQAGAMDIGNLLEWVHSHTS